MSGLFNWKFSTCAVVVLSRFAVWAIYTEKDRLCVTSAHDLEPGDKLSLWYEYWLEVKTVERVTGLPYNFIVDVEGKNIDRLREELTFEVGERAPEPPKFEGGNAVKIYVPCYRYGEKAQAEIMPYDGETNNTLERRSIEDDDVLKICVNNVPELAFHWRDLMRIVGYFGV